MSSMVKDIQLITTRYLQRIFVVMYLLVSIFAEIGIYQHQNNLHKILQEKLLTDNELFQLAKTPLFSGNSDMILSLKLGNGYRELPIANTKWVLAFQQPIVLLLTSPLFIFFSLVFVMLFLIIRRILCNTQSQQLALVNELEDWAGLATLQEKASAIARLNSNKNHEVITTIHQMHQQLNDNYLNEVSSGENIRAIALLDQETGIGNRAFFDNRLQAILKEEDVQGAVLLIQFKEIETVQSLYGYQQAITLLLTIIQITKQRLHSQSSYFIARHSDYELSVLLPNVFIQEVKKITERLLKNLQTIALPEGINKEEFVHIGISYFVDNQTQYRVMSEADMALRAAQLQGPSQWFMFDAGELEEVKTKGSLKWRTFLNSAISSNRFIIYFQPVVASDSGKTLHNEVLSKVRDSNGALISARVFLPMVKKCGLALNIDLLILEQVCQLLTCDKSQKDDCSINISIDSLLSKDFTAQFLSIIARFPELKNRLLIEISEYQLVNHLAQLLSVITDLSAGGIKIVADKVGQFVVSANYLNVYPIFAMKLHNSIVLDIDKKTENQVFMQSLKTLTSPKNIPIYALGVEKKAEWRVLLQLGSKGGQGHLFSEPVAQVIKASHAG